MLPFGYGTNLHAAETVDEVIAFLTAFTAPLRVRLGWNRIGVDLRLGSQAIAELAAPARVAALRRALDAAGASAHTINAFPLRPFQAAVVKDDAYRPDWTDAERARDTAALIPIALALSDEPLVTISTVPGSFRPFGPRANNVAMIAAALGRWAAQAAVAKRDTGRRVVLALEPEPWCLLETSHDAAAFWRGPLMSAGVVAATPLLGDALAARSAVERHLGLCFDTCHTSLAFEDQAAAVARLVAAGVPIVKCQFSAAPEVRDPSWDTAGVAALRALAEPRFLHQTCAVSASGSLSRVRDLDELDACLARLPSAVAVRSHFHVPVDRAATVSGLSSTIADSLAGLHACRAAGCTHVAVETYTWPVLGGDALAGTERELRALERAWHASGLPDFRTSGLPDGR
jgi:sugar phosphate isomerase/epimerase